MDPMLATGGSAADAISMIKKHGVKKIMFMSMFLRIFALLIIMLLTPVYSIGEEVSALGFVEIDPRSQTVITDKVRLTFVRTDSGWTSSCFFEKFHSLIEDHSANEVLSASSACTHQIMKSSWQIIDADGNYINAGTLKPSKAAYCGEVGFVSIAKPLKYKLKFDSTRQSRYTWDGTTYPPLLAVPKGTRVDKIQPVAMNGSVEQKIKDKLVKQYFRKGRTVRKCDSNENLVSERAAKSSDVVIKPLAGFKDNVSFYEVLVPDTSGCGIMDDEMELMAVKGSEVVNLSGTSELADDDRPMTTSLSLFNRYVISTKKLQDTVYVFFAGGYNLDGYVLLDSELNVRGISTWNYH